MRRVYVAESAIEIAHLRNLLETEGIGCEVRNDRLGGVIGEIPFVECWPELWVRETGQVLRARALIDAALHPADAGEPWNCPRCGERLEAQFSVCWRCGTEAPAEAGSR